MRKIGHLSVVLSIFAISACGWAGGCSETEGGDLSALVELEYIYADVSNTQDPIRARMAVTYMNGGRTTIILARKQMGYLVSDDRLYSAQIEMIQHEPYELSLEPGQFLDVVYEKVAVLSTEGKIPCDQGIMGKFQITGQNGPDALDLVVETPLRTLLCSPE